MGGHSNGTRISDTTSLSPMDYLPPTEFRLRLTEQSETPAASELWL